MQVLWIERRTSFALFEGPERVDPFDQNAAYIVIPTRGQYRRQFAQQFEIPVLLTTGDDRMVILEEAPDFAGEKQRVELRGREYCRRKTRAGRELLILLEYVRCTFRSRPFGDRFSIDQQLEIVGPGFPVAHEPHAEYQRTCITIQRKRNRVALPGIANLRS